MYLTEYAGAGWAVPWIALITSALVGWSIVLTKRWHGALTLDHTDGCQKFHQAPTPRVGGVALLAGLVCALAVAPESPPLLATAMLAGLPAFFAGLAEDVTQKVGVSARLAATVLSGVLVCLLTDTWLSSVDLPLVDRVFAIPVLAIPVTAVALAGVANAVNMIDGFNGLAGGVAVVIFTALGVMAAGVGDSELALACFLVASAVVGFLVVNFPAGKLFLGDGGAYFLGFLLAWFCVLLAERNPGAVSPWAGLMACAYPVLEMFFSMWRKTRREGAHMSRPDRLHFHMLIHQRVVRRLMPNARPVLRNAATAPFGWLFAIATCCLAVLLVDSSGALLVAFLFSASAYGALYVRLAKFRWPGRAPRSALRVDGVSH